MTRIALFLYLAVCVNLAQSFVVTWEQPSPTIARTRRLPVALLSVTGANGDVGTDGKDGETGVWDCTVPPDPAAQRGSRLKRDLFQLGASYNRGFGASPRARTETMRVIEELEGLYEPPTQGAAAGVDGTSGTTTTATAGQSPPPLQGSWRLLWTSGPDVLVLDVNPFFSVGAIFQVFDPPLVTNVIDLQPKVQALLPPSLVPNTLLRAKVITRGNQRTGKPNRVGLVFERVELQPLQVLGKEIGIFPPLGFDLPRMFGAVSTAEPTSADAPGYLDVTYLDEEVLVYRQQGSAVFCFIKVDTIDP